MNNNSESFEKYLEENKIYMLKGENVKDVTHFSFPETITIDGIKKNVLGGGAVRRAVISLRNDDTMVDIYCFNIAKVPESIDLYKLYTVLNDLNSSYKFITFYETNDYINAKSCLPLNNSFDPGLIFHMLSIIFKAVDTEYEKIISTLK